MLNTKYNTLLLRPIFKETISCEIDDISYSKPCLHHSRKLNHYHKRSKSTYVMHLFIYIKSFKEEFVIS